MECRRPVLVDGAAERPRKTIFYDMARRRQEFDRKGPDIGPALRAKLETFDGAANPSRVPRPPAFGELVGQPLDRVRVVDGGCAVSIENLAEFSRIDRDAGSMPFEVAGQLDAGSPTDRLPFLAVAVNGTIRAVTRAWQNAPGEWVATPPLDAWRNRREFRRSVQGGRAAGGVAPSQVYSFATSLRRAIAGERTRSNHPFRYRQNVRAAMNQSRRPIFLPSALLRG